MIEQMTEIATKAGPMNAFVTHPQEGGPFPAVVVYMDIWGLREELFDIARRIATAGYHVTLPNLYYRQGDVRFEQRDAQGRMVSFKLLAEDEHRPRAPGGAAAARLERVRLAQRPRRRVRRRSPAGSA